MWHARFGTHKVSDVACFELLHDEAVVAVDIHAVVVCFWDSIRNEPGGDVDLDFFLAQGDDLVRANPCLVKDQIYAWTSRFIST